MAFTLTIETHGAAFVGGDDDYGPGSEVARILREIADRLDQNGLVRGDGLCRDYNGNSCGASVATTL